MEQQRTPVEARGGVISGRVFLVLVSSILGAIVALGVSWLVLFARG